MVEERARRRDESSLPTRGPRDRPTGSSGARTSTPATSAPRSRTCCAVLAALADAFKIVLSFGGPARPSEPTLILDDDLRPGPGRARICSRAAPVPTSRTGVEALPLDQRRRRRGRPPAGRHRRAPVERLAPRPTRSQARARRGGSRSGAPGSPPSRYRREAVADADPELVEGREHVELRQCERGDPVQPHGVASATRSSQPGRRSRPVTVPYSWPSSRTFAASSSSISLGNGPAPDAGDVGLRDADHLVDPRRPDPDARRGGARDRVRRGDERIRAVVEVEQRPLRAFEEDPLALAERRVDEERRVRDVRPEALRQPFVALERPPRGSNGSWS